MNKQIGQRVASIDILRAITMTLMIFVNDLWSLKDIPLWLEHTAADDDSMGLADTIFPAFLFIVGLSIPYAIAARQRKGDSELDIVWHILSRSVALLVMGLWLVNGEYINEAATGMPRLVWNMICVTCFIALWNNYPASFNKSIVRILRMLAAATLLFLAWLYRGGEAEAITYFSKHWWGILGLIGWAYLLSALIYLVANDNRYLNIIAWLLFLLLCIANHAQWLPQNLWLRALISPIGEGAMTALVMGGVVVSQVFRSMLQRSTWKQIVITLLCIGIVMLIIGFAVRPIVGISKIKATPSWVLICSGITVIAFALLYYVADVWQKRNWFRIIEPAGTNTLLCYLLPYYAYGIPMLAGLYLPAVLLTGIVGLIKSFAFALLMVLIGGWLGKLHVNLKL